MWEWLLEVIDISRPEAANPYILWHGRLMVLAWGILSPMAVLIARFGKILPHQKWPEELDNRLWWRCHWIIQTMAVAFSLIALALVWFEGINASAIHHYFGYAVIVLAVQQALFGLFRGSKGGPTAPDKNGTWRGDHYDMTPWRIQFEKWHKSLGYITLLLVVFSIVTGLWLANAPHWMWLVIILWWLFLVGVFVVLQRKGRAYDTYQAIWGAGAEHPGNQREPIGWGIRLPSEDFDQQQRK